MKKLIALIAFTFVSTAAYADGPAFTVADANADGLVSMEEAKSALPDMEADKIAAADTNQDGSLSVEEYTALTAS